MKLEVVIPSRKRTKVIPRALSHFIDPIVCVAEEEEAEYRRALGSKVRILAHPNGQRLPEIRQWILDTVEADAIFTVADDLKMVKAMPGYLPRRILDPEVIREIIVNCALNAQEAGTPLFTFAENLNSRFYNPHRPFRLHGLMIGGVQGIWRDEFNANVRYDPDIRRTHIDVCMRVIQKYRFLWMDTRFAFVPGVHVTSAVGGIKSTSETIMLANQEIADRYGDQVCIDYGRGKRKGAHSIGQEFRLRLPF